MWTSLSLLALGLAVLWVVSARPEPVFPVSRDPDEAERLEKELQPVLELSEAELVRLVPERAGLYFVGCPHCDGGTQENQLSWSIERPDEVFCRFCGTRYPNKTYPDDRKLRVENPKGEIQEYPYWEDEKGYRYFFRAKGWFLAREYFAGAAYDLARLYAVTGKEEYARRAGLILRRFAQVYPGYCVHYDYPFRQKIIFSKDQGFPYPVPDFRAAKWSWWAYMDIPENLLRAYDLVRNSKALDEEARRRIEEDLFRASASFVRSYPPGLTNMDPTLLRGLVTAGLVLEEPEYIHHAVDWIGRLVQKQFFCDGVWREGALSYHEQTVGGLNRLIDLLSGYSDPGEYTHPGTSERFDHLDLTRRFPILEKARRIPELLRYPNGRVVAFHDTWAKTGRAPMRSSVPLLLPGLGHARLGRGEDENQIQLHLHFSGGYGHQHADLLSITLFAHGAERISDIGYTHTRYRRWTLTTLSHNTVTVDGQDQYDGSSGDPSDGDLLLYAPLSPSFQVVEADGRRGYPGIVRKYRRMLLLVGISPAEAYVVDFFRVLGGSRHEYVLVGDADHDGRLECGLPLVPHGETLLPEGVSARLPEGENLPGEAGGHNIGYAFIRQVQRARTSGPWTATFRSRAEPEGAVRVHATAESGDLLFRGTVPSIRRADENDAELDRFTMPALVLRREGEDLSSFFANVLEPFGGQPVLESVERLDVDSEEGAALRVSWSGGTDYLICNMGTDASLRAGELVLEGRAGFVRERRGKIERMILVGGRLLAKGDIRLEGQGILSGTIQQVYRVAGGDAVDGFVVDTSLSAGKEWKGLFALVKDGAGFTHGCEISEVRKERGRTLLVLAGDPGFEMLPDGTSRHCFFPGRSWKGTNRFEIATVSVWAP